MQKIQIVQFLFAFVLLASFAVASNFEEALQAHDSGDFKKAHKLWLIDAEQGDAAAQVNLGAMYNLGHGVPQDYKESVKWYRLAAEQGNAQAQTKLGIMYNLGKGVPQDYKASVKWFRLAAEQGDAHAQYNLGLMYLNGYGVVQSYEDAYAWWVVAAANGSESARGNMSVAQGGQMTAKQIEKGQQLAKEIWTRLGN
jgi:TPR repeat protein